MVKAMLSVRSNHHARAGRGNYSMGVIERVNHEFNSRTVLASSMDERTLSFSRFEACSCSF